MEKLKYLYKYPFGTVVKIKDKDFIYFSKTIFGYIFYSDGKIYYDEELYELYGVDDESLVYFLVRNSKCMLNDLIDAITKYIVILSEDNINKEEIESQKERLKLYSDILKIIK